MRPKRTSLAKHPDTKLTHHKGACTLCNAEAAKRGAPRPAFELNSAAAALGYWLNDRRNRGVPEHGYPI
ncbi:hypothetical protein [Pseudarthrobacter sp. S9]|uniref:hypothetical protein n=1 Tax=Pseudarthrobacter sp. S9 TaxID=3418421 RepID=UPI003D08903E